MRPHSAISTYRSSLLRNRLRHTCNHDLVGNLSDARIRSTICTCGECRSDAVEGSNDTHGIALALFHGGNFLHGVGVDLPECIQQDRCNVCGARNSLHVLADLGHRRLVLRGDEQTPLNAEAPLWRATTWHVVWGREEQLSVLCVFELQPGGGEIMPANRAGGHPMLRRSQHSIRVPTRKATALRA